MKVFVLICESMYDGGNIEVSSSVYDSEEKARTQMLKEYEDARGEWNGESYSHETGENYAQHFDYDYPNENHITWSIEENEIL